MCTAAAVSFVIMLHEHAVIALTAVLPMVAKYSAVIVVIVDTGICSSIITGILCMYLAIAALFASPPLVLSPELSPCRIYNGGNCIIVGDCNLS